MPQIFPYYLGDLAGLRAGGDPDRRPDRAARRHGADAGLQRRRRWTRGRARVAASARRAAAALAIVGALIVADLGYGALRLHQVDARRAAAPKVRTGIVQANVGIIEKWDPREFARLLATAPARVGRAGARRRRADRLARVVVPVRARRAPEPFAHDFAARRRRAACGAASTRRSCSAPSRAPSGRRARRPIATPTTPR